MFAQAKNVLVGGVNSPVRAFKSVGGDPVFFASAKGSKLTDVDGNSYIDYVGSWGPMILGHANPKVTESVKAAAEKGTSFGAPGEMEHKLGELVAEMVPGIEKVRFVNSGTEATMSALRLARGATGRPKVIKFEGCYHGHGDSFLIKAGSGALTFGVPDSKGITENIAQDTLTARYNDADSVRQLLEENSGRVAAVIVEPVAGNMGVIPPADGFLQDLRTLCSDNGALLIFDEVMTGFRVDPGGAQRRYGIKPDITTLGKVIGGGLPVGAYGGPAKIMDQVSPLGPIYQAGTLSGNPLAMTAGLMTLRQLTDSVYQQIEEYGSKLEEGLKAEARQAGVPIVINRVGSMLTVFFTKLPGVTDFETARSTDTERFAGFFHAMLEGGAYLPPSGFEAWFISAAHSRDDLEKTLAVAKEAFAAI
jgi:glutamate-1-semialdehyde 2,1-aminomutase